MIFLFLGKTFVDFKNFRLIKDFFSIFGDLILFLYIRFDQIDGAEGVNIMKFVNDNSSELLRELNLTRCRGNVLVELKTVFSGVISMVFSVDKTEIFISTGQKLSFHFPNLQNFIVLNARISDWDFINGHFPKLVKFSVKIPSDKQTKIDETKIIDFLKSNTQIDTLEIRSPSLKLLRATNDILQNLMSLKLSSIDSDYSNYIDDAIHFNSVKELIIKSISIAPKMIFFNQLMKLSLNVKPELTAEWLTFINRNLNRELNVFSLTTEKLTNEQLQNILIKLTTLNDVTIKSKSKFTAKNIVDLVESRNFLYNIRFDVLMDKKEQVKLKKKLNSSDCTTKIMPFQSARDRVDIEILR